MATVIDGARALWDLATSKGTAVEVRLELYKSLRNILDGLIQATTQELSDAGTPTSAVATALEELKAEEEANAGAAALGGLGLDDYCHHEDDRDDGAEVELPYDTKRLIKNRMETSGLTLAAAVEQTSREVIKRGKDKGSHRPRIFVRRLPQPE